MNLFDMFEPGEKQDIEEACWKGYHKEGMKTMFGKRYPNCVKNKNESLETYVNKGECPGCGGVMVSEEQINEKQDACYHKVKSRYKVWPSAYASGALVQCRKKGAANWGNKNESITQEEYDQLDENLKQWFSDKWVRFGPDGKIRGDCARGDSSEGKPKCLPQSKAHALGKKGRASAAARKRREDPNPERSGKAINVTTKKKSNEGVAEGKLVESAVFLNPTTVVVGQAHGQPLELSPNTLKQIQAIAAKHGAWYEGNGTDRGYTKGQIDRYVGSWDDEVAKTASPNDPKWLYVLFANVDENNRVQRVGIDPDDTIFNRLLDTAKDNSFQGIGYTSQALQKFLQMASEGKYDFLKMSQQPATQENLTRFLKAGEALMWPSNWEQYPNKAGKIAKAATVDVRDQYLATRKAGVYVTGSGHLKAVQNITGKQGVAEGLNESLLSSLVSQDQAERNEYKNFVKSQAGGDWAKGAKMYAQLKKRPSDDIFGDTARLNQFMKMKFDFDKFTDEDWDNYWLLAQHCDDNRDFQKNALSIIKKYQGTDNSHYKYLYDRISMGLTGKQKYGTQNVKEQGVAEAATDDPRFQKMMGNIQQSTPNPVDGYVAVSYASERPSKKIKGVTYNGKPMPSTVDPEGFASSKIKFTPDQIEAKLAGIGQKYGWDRIDPGHGQGYDELYFDTSTEYTSATQRQLAVNIVKTVNEINKFFTGMNSSLQATGLPGYKVNVWQGMGENGNINQYQDLSHITNIAKGQTAKPDAGPAIGKMILKHLPSYEAENDELGYDPQDFQAARDIANIYITKGERAGLQAQGDSEVSEMIDELLSDAGASGLRTIWDLDEQGVAEGYEPGDKITWYHSNHHPEIEGTVVGWKDGHLIVKSIDPQPRNTEKTVAKYRVPKNNILSHDKQGVAEAATDDPRFQKAMGNIVNTTPRAVVQYPSDLISPDASPDERDRLSTPIRRPNAKVFQKMLNNFLDMRKDGVDTEEALDNIRYDLEQSDYEWTDDEIASILGDLNANDIPDDDRFESQGVAEGSNELYQKAIRKYAQQVANDYLGGGNDYLYGANKFDSEMFGVDPKQAQQDFKTLFAQLTKQQGVAEGSSDTVYPNAEVIKSKNGKPVGEIYQDGNSWGAFHYRADRGYDLIDSREDAIEALRDLHQETGRSRPDYTIKGVAEASISTQVNLPKWQIGLPVFVKHLGQKGKIASLSNDSAIVDVGMRQYRVPLDGLKRYPSRGVTEGSNKKQEATRRIQKMLNDKFGANLDVDGVLGPLTLKSINKFMPNAKVGPAKDPNKTTAVQGKKVKNEDIDQNQLAEKWSQKYKSSINCSNPKGFSQRAHCDGKKKNEDVTETTEYNYSNINDDDWYEFDSEGNVVRQSGPGRYELPFGSNRTIKLPNGNIAAKGMTAKRLKLFKNLSESREYYNVTSTDSTSLRQDFNMSKDRFGWYLSEGSTPKHKLDAYRAFGSPKLKEYDLSAFSGGTQTKGEDNVISPVGSQTRSQYKK